MDRRTLIAAGATAVSLPVLRRFGARGRAARPAPTPAQLRWQREETALFIHFGINTFTDREWGDGTESPSLFGPVALDARQWARAARAAGAGSLVLTAKHHDGFCLWPTTTTRHSVASSPWRSGTGDVMQEFVDACRAERLGAGVYLSPWDRNAPSYGEGDRYDDFYIAQLTELLTRYGPLVEVWFDGANGEGPNGKRQAYDWPRIHRTVRALQPEAVIFSDAGPDVRWIGNERGVAGETCWSTIDPGSVPYPGYDAPGVGEVLQRGHPHGAVWRPGETDVSIRPGWFWHPAEDAKVRSVENLVDLHFTSVGRNSKLLLNVPPTREGMLHPADVQRLQGYGEAIRELYASDLMASSLSRKAGADRLVDGDRESWWAPAGTSGSVELEVGRPVGCTVVCLEEAIRHGQTVEAYRVEARMGGVWREIARGTTIGHRRLHRIELVAADRVRLTIERALDVPRIARLSLF
ncbi:MAG TPA: alpha-L-fucosidase [Gemmatimonadales bacterium]|nr:alpha-L-fucosidase [Gemmatimonadales bacterium]